MPKDYPTCEILHVEILLWRCLLQVAGHFESLYKELLNPTPL